MKIAIVTKRCIRCKSMKTLPYAARFYCLACGFTFNRISTDETDELIKRQLFMLKEGK